MSILIFIIVLIIVLSLHEFGHFILAKVFGVRVDEFGIGYPPRIWGKKIKDTIYSINWLPFGAFVKILGEDRDNENDANSFSSQKAWKRLLVLSGGIIMNLLCGMLLLGVGYAIGLPVLVNEDEVNQVENVGLSILGVSGNSPAELSGLKAGDIVLSMKSGEDEIKDLTAITFSDFIKNYLGKEIILSVKTTDGILERKAVPRENPPEGQGPVGVAIADFPYLLMQKCSTLSPQCAGSAVVGGVRATGEWTSRVAEGLRGIGKSLVAGKTPEGVTGPVGIYQLTDVVSRGGAWPLVELVAVLSVNLAVFNVLPIPALDGGRMFFIWLEWARRKRLPAKMEQRVNAWGMAVLLSLLALITLQDVIRVGGIDKLLKLVRLK